MQVRDLIEQLQQFDPRSEVAFEVNLESNETADPVEVDFKDCEVKRGPDTARIVLEG